MNSSDVHERRRVAAAILKSKFGTSHGFQYHHHHLHDTKEEDEGECEFIDSVARHQHIQPVQAAPHNRVARFVPVSLTGRVAPASPPLPPRQKTASKVTSSIQEHKNKYLLGENYLHKKPQAQQLIGTSALRGPHSPLNPVIESTSESYDCNKEAAMGLAGPPRLASAAGRHPSDQWQQQVRPSRQQQRSSRPVRDDRLVASFNQNQCELVDEVKRRLSLPNDTSIPNSFLLKHRDKLNAFKSEPGVELSRVHRRQSLFEIGFGRAATYSKLHVLGAGTYSIVYKGSSRLTNRLVALKEIHLERDEGVPFTAIREVSLLKQLRHCNIITLHDIIYANKSLTLVFEFVDRDLSHYMEECDHKINPENVKLFLFQLLRALAYCHARKILHRDLKPQNIMISLSGELKLADFGLARAKSFPTKTYTDEVVTLWYRPPDVLLGNVDYGPCIDMWGVGCIFFEMIAGFTIFLGTDPVKQLNCIFEILGTPTEATWPGIKTDLSCNEFDIPTYEGRDLAQMAPQRLDEEATDLLGRLLKCNPKQRISSHEALRHKYLSSFPAGVHDLHDSQSIFSVEGVRLLPEAHMRPPEPHDGRQPVQGNHRNANNINSRTNIENT